MKKFSSILFISLFMFACSSVQQNSLTQVSTIDALLAGYYDGVIPLDKLQDYGDFGIGTFNKLDGEMIVLDGKIYQFKSDGKIYPADLNDTTPFTSVVNFSAAVSRDLTAIKNYDDFQTKVDSLIKNKNLFYAVKATGKFSYMKTRTVPVQEKPYKPLSEVTKTQPIFEKQEQTGTLVGFKLPAFTSGINVPGYHLHFISSDFSFGGHVLDLAADNVKIEIQVIDRFNMILPGSSSEFGAIDLGKDRSKELHDVEK